MEEGKKNLPESTCKRRRGLASAVDTGVSGGDGRGNGTDLELQSNPILDRLESS